MVKASSSSELQKAVWNEDGDAKMAAAFASKQRGTGNWTTSSKRSGQRRSGKMCRERWSSNQKGDPKLQSFTPQEEELIIQLHAVIGSRWTIIAQQLPEKTESEVKIVWNSKLKKKLSAMGIDPVTHKPFSQILADYGSMGAFPRPRDLKGALQIQTAAVKSEISDSDHLYSQLEAIEASSEGSAAAQEASSFSWSDFFLEEAFAAQENGGQFGGGGGGDDEISEVRKIEGGGGGGGGSEGLGFDATAAASSSSSSAFVEAMIGKQDEMCSQLPCFYEEPFYY